MPAVIFVTLACCDICGRIALACCIAAGPSHFILGTALERKASYSYTVSARAEKFTNWYNKGVVGSTAVPKVLGYLSVAEVKEGAQNEHKDAAVNSKPCCPPCHPSRNLTSLGC